ncbi:TOBE domain-containing protein [Seohaeicola zhoushanensis]|uniref:Transport-associated OB type 2 domain-containing protein n=1 Tax=Seohaeicola zhoushanensis TaxID=1569283 RepID=A0A8J3M8D3_9RHOB|nr:TOBE domain-containing protein [Seohaeicola zhoushanensis]GHF53551.1 hypothetical protein GCM10017056_26460 [Seohaeicola zhoushanensis]
MSDRIAVMFEGNIAQIDTPERLYRRPVNRRVASFIGVMNFLDARATTAPGGLALDIAALGRVDLPSDRLPQGIDPAAVTTIGVRPEMLTLLFDPADRAERTTPGRVTGTSYYGDMTYYSVALEGVDKPVTISMRNTAGRSVLPPGSPVTVGWGAESIVLFQ